MMHISEHDYQLLSRYLDGELEAAAAAGLEQRLAREPRLGAALADMRALQQRLQKAYLPFAGEPVPERITALLQGASGRIRPLPHRLLSGNTRLRWGMAVAASLVAAAGALFLVLDGPTPAQRDHDGIDIALSKALETSPSRASGWETLDDGRALRPVLSFQHKTGSWCREYLVTDGADRWHGVACRDNRGWATAVMTAAELAGSTADYRPAGAADADAIADFIDVNAADIPLDASEEAQLIAREWR